MHRTPEETGSEPTWPEMAFRIPPQGGLVRITQCLHETPDSWAAVVMLLAPLASEGGYSHYLRTKMLPSSYHHQKMTYCPCILTSPILNQISSRCVCLPIYALGRGALTLKEVGKTIVWCFLILWQKQGSNSHYDSIACRILWTLERILDARQLK